MTRLDISALHNQNRSLKLIIVKFLQEELLIYMFLQEMYRIWYQIILKHIFLHILLCKRFGHCLSSILTT